MAPAPRTSSGHTASPSTSTSTAPAAATATMIASSSAPPSPAGPPPHPVPVGPWGGGPNNSSCRACFSDFAAVLVVLVCFSCVGLCIHYAARVLLRCLDRRRRRGAAAREAQAQEPPNKPPSDADADGASSPVAAGVWAEAECAICLAELDDLEGGGGGGERVRVHVLPGCGHGFHAACVEAWLATRASCPTCRAPSSSFRSRPPVADDETAVAKPDQAGFPPDGR